MSEDIVINANHWGLIFLIIGLLSPFLIYLLKFIKNNRDKQNESNTGTFKELSDAIKYNSEVTFELSASLKEQKLSCELMRKPIEKQLVTQDKDLKNIKSDIGKQEMSIVIQEKDIKELRRTISEHENSISIIKEDIKHKMNLI